MLQVRLVWGRGRAKTSRSIASVALALGALTALPRGARADVAECAAKHAHGQAERNAGHLISSKADFVACSASSCPSAIQSECMAFMAELEQYLPSVVFAAVDESGADVIDVKVRVDDQQVLEKLTGLALPLDPGSHSVVYVWPDGVEQKQTVVVAQGEKNRRFELRREPKQAQASVAPPPPPPPPKKSAPVGAYLLGGVGVLALGSFAVFAITGKSAEQDMDACKPFCAQAQADKMRLRYLIADISLGVGVVALGASGYLYFRSSREPATSAWNGGTLNYQGAF